MGACRAGSPRFCGVPFVLNCGGFSPCYAGAKVAGGSSQAAVARGSGIVRGFLERKSLRALLFLPVFCLGFAAQKFEGVFRAADAADFGEP